MLNGNETEFIQISNKSHSLSTSSTIVKVGTDDVHTSHSTKNLGIIFDSEMSLTPHIQAMCKSANYQLFQISRI